MPRPVKNHPSARLHLYNPARRFLQHAGITIATLALFFPGLHALDKAADPAVANGPAVLWGNPSDLSTRNLYYGIGGKEHEPRAPFTFVKEDLDGSNPKYVVTDAAGVKWKVKLGQEVRSETAASRLVWAAGYFTPEDYFVANIQVSGVPAKLQRGRKLIGPEGEMHNVRLKREDKEAKKLDVWAWKDNPFNGTREMSGLRIMMALINNWDLKDINNAIVKEGSQNVYMVSDLGATFGSAGRSFPHKRAKDNLESYTNSKFITRTGIETIDFATPARPSFEYLVGLKEYFARVHLEYIRRNIPREDARWIGNVLAQLTPDQLRDAFRASGYSPEEVDAFTQVVRQRIAALKAL